MEIAKNVGDHISNCVLPVQFKTAKIITIDPPQPSKLLGKRFRLAEDLCRNYPCANPFHLSDSTCKLVPRCHFAADLALNPDLHITTQTPPMFLLQAEDDHVDNVNDSLAYYIALKNAGVPVEMHLYAQGGHAFGLRPTKFPITKWPQLVETWLRTIRIISE